MNSSPIKKEYHEHPSVKTPPLNTIDDVMRITKYVTQSVIGASHETINPKVPHVAVRLQTSESNLGQSDQAISLHGQRSPASSSEPQGLLENTTNDDSESTESPEDQSLLNPPRSTKRKRRSPSDPDYVDSESEKKNTRSPKKSKEVESPEAKLKKKSRELASERSNSTKLRKANERLREEIKQLQAKVKKEQRQKQESSRRYAKKLKAAPVVAEDESVLRQSLKKLGQTCARWAESYATVSGSDHDLSQEQSLNILEVLKTYQAISLEGQEVIFLEQKCREILLNAILTHLVYVEILARPFYFFQHALDIGGPKSIEENLVWLHKFTSAGGTPQQVSAARWQAMLAQTLRALHGQKDTDSKGTNKEQLRKLQAKYFDRLTKRLEDSCAGVLKSLNPEEMKERTQQINNILKAAGNLSFRLWAQGYEIACLSLGRLEKTFTKASPDMEPHLTMLLDDDDTSRDGQKIHLVVKPCIDAYGNDEGKYFGERRTLDPATILICRHRMEMPDSPMNIAQELPDSRTGQLNEVHSSAFGQDLTTNTSSVRYTYSEESLNGGSARPDQKIAQAKVQAEIVPDIKVKGDYASPIAGLTGEIAGASSLQASSNGDSLSSHETQPESVPSKHKALSGLVQIQNEGEIRHPTSTVEVVIKKTTQSQDQLNDHTAPAVTKFSGVPKREATSTSNLSPVNKDIPWI